MLESSDSIMSNENTEKYYTPCDRKHIEQVKLFISRAVYGDQSILKDFYKFWHNINTNQELYDYLLFCFAQIESNMTKHIAAIILLTLNQQRINQTNINYLNTIFRKLGDSDFTSFKEIILQNTPKLMNFFAIWVKHVSNDPILPIICTLLYPTIVHKSDPFLFLHQFTSSPDIFRIILRYSLFFRTSSESNLKQTYESFMKNFNDPYLLQCQQPHATLLTEMSIPYSNAALYNYDLIKCSSTSHILFIPFQMYKTFLNIEVYSTVNQFQSIYSLLDNLYYEKFKDEDISPDPKYLNEIFEKLIISSKHAYTVFSNIDVDINDQTIMYDSELWEFLISRSVPRTSQPKVYTPLMYPFEPSELPNDIFLVFSSTKVNGVPFLSGSSRNPFDKMKQGNKSDLYAAVIGGGAEMMNALIDYVTFLFEHRSDSIKKKLFVLPILKEDSRLSHFLNENDVCIRHTSNEFIKLMFDSFPSISRKVNDSNLPILAPSDSSEFPNDLWRESISPFSVFYRFLSFYCGCATFTTKFAVWTAFLTNKKNQVFAVPFIDSVILKPCAISGMIYFNLSSPVNDTNQVQLECYKFNAISDDIKVMNMSLPSENCFLCSPEDNALILETNNLISEASFNNQLILICSLMIKSGSNEFFDLYIDSVKFSNIKCLKIERLKKDQEDIYFPLRHFSPLKNGFE